MGAFLQFEPFLATKIVCKAEFQSSMADIVICLFRAVVYWLPNENSNFVILTIWGLA